MHEDFKATLSGFSVERANVSCSKRDFAFTVECFRSCVDSRQGLKGEGWKRKRSVLLRIPGLRVQGSKASQKMG